MLHVFSNHKRVEIFTDLFRNILWQIFFKIGVPKNPTNITGKHLCWVTTKTENHLKPLETTRKNPKPSETTQNFLQPNHKVPKITYN